MVAVPLRVRLPGQSASSSSRSSGIGTVRRGRRPSARGAGRATRRSRSRTRASTRRSGARPRAPRRAPRSRTPCSSSRPRARAGGGSRCGARPPRWPLDEDPRLVAHLRLAPGAGAGDFVVRALRGYDERGADEGLAAFEIHARSSRSASSDASEPFSPDSPIRSYLPGIGRARLRTTAAASRSPHSARRRCARACSSRSLDGGRASRAFRSAKMRLLAGVAHQAKLAITNAMSFESLEETFLSTVEALANALEANDEYTSSHARCDHRHGARGRQRARARRRRR